MTDKDEHNFSSSPTHRLPTYSASAALQQVSSTPLRPIATGLHSLDHVLQNQDADNMGPETKGGVSRGELTELYGPPGVGKTTLAAQIAANELQLDSSVVWVDTSSRLVPSRLNALLASAHAEQQVEDSLSSSDAAQKLRRFYCPSLAHLLALFSNASSSFLAKDTSLIVIDSVSTLFNAAYPTRPEDKLDSSAPQRKRDLAQWAAARRYSVMGELANRLERLAATQSIAILLVNQTNTKIRANSAAHLQPAVSGAAWEKAIPNRVVIFRDWLPQPRNKPYDQNLNARFAGAMKVKGVVIDCTRMLSAFKIEENGILEIRYEKPLSDALPTEANLKRKRQDTGDGESEPEEEDPESDVEFGWGTEDETLGTDGIEQ